MEIWELFDVERRPLGRTHRRGEPMDPGEYHIDVEIWTVDSRKQILVTLRDPRKEHYPNCWECTGGSALAGESSRQAAVRELFEETGIAAGEEELIFLGTHREDNALVDIYLLRRDVPISSLTMQDGETVAARWISLEELRQRIADLTFALPIGEHFETVRERFEQQLELG